MKLHEAIVRVLEDNNKPLTIEDLVLLLNNKKHYLRKDEKLLDNSQVFARIKNYPSLFENINGIIILIDNLHWKKIITSYWYLKETLRGIFSESEIQFIIASLFFYKRLLDINERNGRGYPIDFIKVSNSSIDKLLDGGKFWAKSLKEIDDFFIAPEGIFEDLSKELLKLEAFKREEIQNVILNLDTSAFSDFEFGNIYEYILYLNSKDYFGYQNSTPESIRTLLPRLIKIPSDKTVYDPVSGLGGLLSKVYDSNNNVNIKGSEINKRIAQLGNMNLMMHGINQTSTILSEDCFEEINSSRKYDFIIGDLPINGITNSYEYFVLYEKFNIKPTRSGKSFNSLVLLSYYKLSDKGVAFLVVSDSFLIKGGKEKEIRKILIENDAVEAVISLPRGTYRPYTEAKSSILILNKCKPSNFIKKIKFIKINALEDSKKYVLLDEEQIVKEYESEITSPKFTQVIELKDIDSDINLSAEKYDVQFYLGNLMLKEGTGKLIKYIVNIKTGKQPKKEELVKDGNLPIIKIENLTKDILDIGLNVNIHFLDKVNSSRSYSSSVISSECVLIAKIGDNLKPTIFRPTSELPSILIHSGVFALIPKDNRLDLEYLYYQLNSSFIEEQINSKKSGALIPFLSKSVVEDIIIPFETIETQRKFNNTQRANLIAEESKRFEEKKRALGYEEEIRDTESNVIKSLTHQLNPKFLALVNLVKRIERVIKINELGNLNEYKIIEQESELEGLINKRDNSTLIELVSILERDSKYLGDTMNNVDKVLNMRLSKESLKEVDLLNFFEKYKKEKEILIEGKYKIIIKGVSVKATIDESLFKEAIDSLLINAEKHGFKDGMKDFYEIVFNIKKNDLKNTIIIEYSNNGEPFKLTQDDFIKPFVKGNKSDGMGIGGSIIDKVIKAHKGKISINRNYKQGFFLTIELPINNIDNE